MTTDCALGVAILISTAFFTGFVRNIVTLFYANPPPHPKPTTPPSSTLDRTHHRPSILNHFEALGYCTTLCPLSDGACRRILFLGFFGCLVGALQSVPNPMACARCLSRQAGPPRPTYAIRRAHETSSASTLQRAGAARARSARSFTESQIRRTATDLIARTTFSVSPQYIHAHAHAHTHTHTHTHTYTHTQAGTRTRTRIHRRALSPPATPARHRRLVDLRRLSNSLPMFRYVPQKQHRWVCRKREIPDLSAPDTSLRKPPRHTHTTPPPPPPPPPHTPPPSPPPPRTCTRLRTRART